MSTPKHLLLVSSIFFSCFSLAQEGPGLGVPATPEQIAGWISVLIPAVQTCQQDQAVSRKVLLFT